MRFRDTARFIARQPLFHFLILGGALGALYSWLNEDASEPDTTVRVTAGQVDRLETTWRAQWNRPPTEDELAGLINAYVREVVLYREALAMGLGDDDAIVRRVLAQKLENMSRDLVELSLSPTDQDLEAYLAANMEKYQTPPLTTFTQLYIDADRRGAAALSHAEQLLAELQARGEPTQGIEREGDPFLLPGYYTERSELQIANLFGGEFARAVSKLPVGEWQGPVLSGYGPHLVYVHSHVEYPPPTLLDVKDRVQQDWVSAKREKITDLFFENLLARYEVVIEPRTSESPEVAGAGAR